MLFVQHCVCRPILTVRVFCGIKVNNRNKYSDKLIVYHHNPVRLSKKREELSIIIQSNFISPHLICLSEHHMREQEIISLSLSYRLASSCCRDESSKGGVCILTRNDINFNTTHLKKFCSNKTFNRNLPPLCTAVYCIIFTAGLQDSGHFVHV